MKSASLWMSLLLAGGVNSTAPGNGRYSPPLPANPKLPTLGLIGDSIVRNGILGDGANHNGGARGKGALNGTGDETELIMMNDQPETVPHD